MDSAGAKFFDRGNARHFEWQTESPYVSQTERALAHRAFLPLEGRLLVVGCAEGADLVHLGSPANAVGIDLFQPQLRFARERNGRSRFVRASGLDLPFADASFDQIAVRDVFHHVDDPQRLIRECRRVLRAGGRMDVVEPCVFNPLVLLHGLFKKEERGELRSTPNRIRSMMASSFDLEPIRHYQALPLHRILFHPDLGIPGLEDRPAARRAVAAIERWTDRIAPALFHAYFHVRGRRRPGAAPGNGSAADSR